MAGNCLLQQRALNRGQAAEMPTAELLGQHIAELFPSDPFGAAAAFPWLLCVCRFQVLSPASQDARSTTPRQTLSPCLGSAPLWGHPGCHPCARLSCSAYL